MSWVGTLGLNVPLFLGAYLCARDGVRLAAGASRIIGTAVLAWAWQTLGMELLGVLGLLALGPLVAWSSLAALIGIVIRRRRGPNREEIAASASGNWLTAMALGLILAPCVALGTTSLLGPLKVVSDGPIYHLYFAARWWKAASLFLVPVPFGENAATYFPAIGDLGFTWLFIGWDGDRLAKIGQAPFLVLAGLAAFDLCRRLGARVDSALIAVGWFLTCTPLLFFSFEPNVDTVFVAGYLAALDFLALYTLNERKAGALLLGALAAGCAWGTKPTGAVFVPPLLLLGLALVLSGPLPRRTRRVHAAVWVLGALAMVGFWLGRNLLLTGNPLYPLDVPALGWIGWYDQSVMTRGSYSLPRGDWRSLIDIVLAVFDPRLVPVWCLAILGAWWGPRQAGAKARWVWICSGLAVLNVFLYWWLVPYRTQQRFFLQALGLAAVPLSRLLDRSVFWRWIGLALLALHVSTPQTWPLVPNGATAPWDFSPLIPSAIGAPFPLVGIAGGILWHNLGLLCAAIGVGSVWSWSLDHPGRRRVLVALGATVLLCVLWAVVEPRFPGRDPFFPQSFPDFYPGWIELDQRCGPRGVRIAYAGTNIPYYLFGRGLRNDVRYVNVDAHRDWLLHDYHRAAIAEGHPHWPDYPRPGWDRRHPSYEAWLANLKAARIQVLVVTRVNPAEGPHNVADAAGFPIERAWAESHPESFEPLYGTAERDPQFRFYRFLEKSPPRADF